MSDGGEYWPRTLAEMDKVAAQVNKALKWALFALAAMALILLIDLQLKRSIGKQAVIAAQKHASIMALAGRDWLREQGLVPKEAAGERDTRPAASDPAGHAGDAGRGGVDGNAPVAAGDDQAVRPSADEAAARPVGSGKRAAGNGRRTSRPPGGS